MLDIPRLRQQFPALSAQRNGRTPIFLDGPAGTQVPRRVVEAMSHALFYANANHGGAFATSRESDRILEAAHQAAADFLHAPSADEIIFGQNMTTQTLHLSRALARTWKPGDEILVTRLDHDANVTPWVLAARDAGATVRFVDVHPEDCTLDLASFRSQLNERTRLVAVGLASNVAGTINPVGVIAAEAKRVEALVFVDAVHFAPHGSIDVQTLGCDFLACSAYKFFGPHVGILWGKRALLESLAAYKVRPAPNELPGKWMTGTQNHEGIAGVAACIDYLAEIGRGLGAAGRRGELMAAMAAIQAYERGLGERLLAGLAQRPRFTVWGIRDPQRLHERVPTVIFTDRTQRPRAIAEFLAARDIYVWSGNNYAQEISQRLGLEERGAFVRLGLVHINTEAEIDQTLAVLDELPE
ncbi:MAG: cysteine desulfurase-like protein [Planctomycetota bacterium]